MFFQLSCLVVPPFWNLKLEVYLTRHHFDSTDFSSSLSVRSFNKRLFLSLQWSVRCLSTIDPGKTYVEIGPPESIKGRLNLSSKSLILSDLNLYVVLCSTLILDPARARWWSRWSDPHVGCVSGTGVVVQHSEAVPRPQSTSPHRCRYEGGPSYADPLQAGGAGESDST